MRCRGGLKFTCWLFEKAQQAEKGIGIALSRSKVFRSLQCSEHFENQFQVETFESSQETFVFMREEWVRIENLTNDEINGCKLMKRAKLVRCKLIPIDESKHAKKLIVLTELSRERLCQMELKEV
jgi:hypothetical protein